MHLSEKPELTDNGRAKDNRWTMDAHAMTVK